MVTNKQLSQHDIDAMLSRLGVDGHDAPQSGGETRIKRYDFWHPDKFSKEHLRGLQMIFDGFARLAGSALTSLLRSQVQVRLTSVEQLSYSDYVSQLPDPTAASLITFEPLPDHSILEINLAVAYAMMDRLLGGQGAPVQRGQEVTDIERAMVRLIVSHMLPSLGQAWNPLVSMVPRLEDLVFHTAYIPPVVSGTMAALALLEITAFNTTGTISIAMPYPVLEPVMGRLNAQKLLPVPNRASGSEPHSPDEQMRRATVLIAALLGSATVSMRDLVKLQEGDIIRLESVPGQELEVAVGGSLKFAGLPGLVTNRMAVQITRAVTD